jgi:hypothetical protein
MGIKGENVWGLTRQRRSPIPSSKDRLFILTRKVRGSIFPVQAPILCLGNDFLPCSTSNIGISLIKPATLTFRGRPPTDHLFLGSQVDMYPTCTADYDDASLFEPIDILNTPLDHSHVAPLRISIFIVAHLLIHTSVCTFMPTLLEDGVLGCA